MRRIPWVLTLAAALGACGYASEYEKAVYDYEPVYCYRSIGRVQCFETPYHRDSNRLVNYYGPAPSRYDPPGRPPSPKLTPPPPIDYFVLDPEPIPRPAPRGDIADRPWLGGGVGSTAAPPVDDGPNLSERAAHAAPPLATPGAAAAGASAPVPRTGSI